MKKQTVYNIVLVDDDPDDRFLFREALEGIPVVHDYYEFEDGVDFVGYMQSIHNKDNMFILIFLDLNMPRLSGEQVLAEIKKLSWENIATVVWTTSGKNDFKETCLRLGADQFVTKPNTFSELESKLHSIVQLYHP